MGDQLQLNLTGADARPLVNEALWLLLNCEPEGGYIGAFSGGKDSIVLHEIARRSGVRVEWHYHNTTIDPPGGFAVYA